MAKLARRTKDLTAIKESHRDLYTEKKSTKDGVESSEWVLTEIDNHDDVDILRTVRQENATFRVENTKLKGQQSTFEGLDLERYTTTLAENEALKAEKEATGGKDQKAIDKAVEARLNATVAPLQLKLKNYETELTTHKTNLEKLSAERTGRTIDDAAMAAFNEVGVEKYVYSRSTKTKDDPDGLAWARRVATITDDGKVVHKESGLELKDHLVNMRDDGERPHWFGGSAGTGSAPIGSNGSRVSNPWSAESWDALEQSNIQLKDEGRAKQLASAAGVDVNAPFHPKNGMPKFSQY